MPKRKRIQEIVSSGGWKSVAFDVPFTLESGEDPFEGLIEIEELRDYQIAPVASNSKKVKEKLQEEADLPPSKKKLRAEKRAEDRKEAKKLKKANRVAAIPAVSEPEISNLTEESDFGDVSEDDAPSQTVSSVKKSKKKKEKLSVKKARTSVGSVEEEILDEDLLEVSEDENVTRAPSSLKKSKKNTKKSSGKKNLNAAEVEEEVSGSEGEEESPVEDPTTITDDEVVDLSKWEQLHVSDVILKALKGMKFTTPTPIQEECLPAAIRSRKDIIGAAETGSGKTLAFAIPILQNIMEDKLTETDDKEAGLRALIVTPTRELAVQIKKHITAVGEFSGVTTCLIVGGMFKEKQDRLLKKQPDIVIATPGRLYEHIQNHTPYFHNLSSVRYLVIDEADRMVERGHFRELSDIMRILNDDTRAAAKRQTFVFSATLRMEMEQGMLKTGHRKGKIAASTEEGERIANVLAVLGLKANAKLIDLSKPEGTAGSLLERRLPCTLKDKDYLFYYLLMTEATGRVIVFCNSLDCVRRLYGVFSYLLTETGRSPLVLHAGMHQKQRLKNLERFQANNKAVLLASDVASRGLDIPDVQFVIHYQVPRKPDLYVHRSGRTARAFKVGSSVLLVDPSDAPAAAKILRCLHRDRDFPPVDVDSRMLRFAKERVDLARRIDLVEHALRREASQDEWYLKAAEESDLVLDKDDRRKLEIQKGDGRSRQSKEAKGLKKMMKSLLAQPLKSRMPGFSRQYPALNFAKKKLGFS